jgi:hypothetical protein
MHHKPLMMHEISKCDGGGACPEQVEWVSRRLLVAPSIGPLFNGRTLSQSLSWLSRKTSFGPFRCHGFGTSRSLQIFRARYSSISVCRGMAERRFFTGLVHQECLPPSRRSEQPCCCKWRSNARRFIPSQILQRTRPRQRVGLPRD